MKENNYTSQNWTHSLHVLTHVSKTDITTAPFGSTISTSFNNIWLPANDEECAAWLCYLAAFSMYTKMSTNGLDFSCSGSLKAPAPRTPYLTHQAGGYGMKKIHCDSMWQFVMNVTAEMVHYA